MVNFIAKIVARPSDFHADVVSGVGTTKKEAIERCLEEARKVIAVDVEVAEGIMLSQKEAERLPECVPNGCSLVIFVYVHKGGGGSWCDHVAAVPTGGVVTEHRDGYKEKAKETREITKPIEEISFVDYNDGPFFRLPRGSFLRVDDAWQPARRVR